MTTASIRPHHAVLGAAMLVMADAGLARRAPVPMTARQERLANPPMSDLVDMVAPAGVRRAFRRFTMTDADRAAIAAADARRARRRQRACGMVA